MVAKVLGLLFQNLKFKTHHSLLSKYNVWRTKKGFKEAGKIQMAKKVNSNLVNQIEDLIKTVELSDINLPCKRNAILHIKVIQN